MENQNPGKTSTFFLCPCGEEISKGRAKLGYRECLACGEERARRGTFCVVNMHKSNYVVVNRREDLKGLNKYAAD